MLLFCFVFCFFHLCFFFDPSSVHIYKHIHTHARIRARAHTAIERQTMLDKGLKITRFHSTLTHRTAGSRYLYIFSGGGTKCLSLKPPTAAGETPRVLRGAEAALPHCECFAEPTTDQLPRATTRAAAAAARVYRSRPSRSISSMRKSMSDCVAAGLETTMRKKLTLLA